MKELENILNENLYINKINNVLENGGVIAFVTDTVWGLGCLPYSREGVDKIYEIKGRDREKPLILMSDTTEHLMPYVKFVPENAKDIMTKYFPGALTLIFEKSDKTPNYITSNKNTVGIRVPDNPVFHKLCSLINGHVLATTSANLSNHPSSKTYEEALNSIGEYADIVIEDYGYKCEGLESTVAIVNENTTKVLRQGSIFI